MITPEVEANITSAYAYIAEHSPVDAAKWLRGLYKRIGTLETVPCRFGKAREQAYSKQDLRQLIYKSHRIVFIFDDKSRTVNVFYVRHARMCTVGEPSDDE